MSEGLTISAGTADGAGRRLVIAAMGEIVHRHRFDTESQFQRQKFREAVVEKFSLGEDAHEWIEQEVLRAADNEDERTDASSHLPVLTKLSDVTPEEIDWLWPGRIALGKITLICGDPGVNKSFFLLDLAARISLGSRWPDCDASAPMGSSILLAGEDGLSDTIVPRLVAAGADLDRITAMSAIKGADSGGDYQRQVDLQRDMPAIEKAIQPDGKLLGIDPITCYMGNIDGHSNSDVRRVLAPLAELADRRKIAVVCVTHLRKSEGAAVYRTMGSLAFAAAARAVWAIVKDKKDPEQRRRLFLPVKNNIGGDQSGLAFELSSRYSGAMPCLVWEAEPVRTTADEALATERRKPGPEPEEREDAESFLRKILGAGPRLVKEVEDEARVAHSISKRTLDRARRTVGVEAFREAPTGPWSIRLATLPTTMPPDTPTQNHGHLGTVAYTPEKNKKLAFACDPPCQDAGMPVCANGHGGLPPGDTF